jgi:hypothetical protein
MWSDILFYILYLQALIGYFGSQKDMELGTAFKGSDQRENRRVWSNINTRYLVWGCGDGRSFVL